jgi:cellulose synthase/poly-beta-1,6-N-acetylglucosamine synthase-like glycosyltransferase
MPDGPRVSVVIPSFNGADTLPELLGALERQTYPRADFEVIVADDVSTDDTAAVAVAHGAKVVTTRVNGGAAAARNAGFAQARGEVIAFVDDDCAPATDWLAELVAPFDDPAVDGAGGRILPFEGDGLVLSYLTARNPWAALGANLLRSSSPLYRLGLYLAATLLPGQEPEPPEELFAVAGANMAFRASVLRELGGFSTDLRVSEETDFCQRAHARPGGARIAYRPNAVTRHHFEASVGELSRRARWYGQGAAGLAQRHATINYIVYPFPAVLLAMIAVVVRVRGLRALPLLPLLPLLAYPGWALFAARRKRLAPVLFPYLQLLQETSTMLGQADVVVRGVKP